MRSRRSANRRVPSGIALVITLVVILLITTLLSQFNYTTSIELRSLQTQKESMQARALARSAFKAVQASLLQDESDFLLGYGQLKGVLAFSAVPWEEGLLTELEVEPLDPLFNLNRMYRYREGEPQETVLRGLFQRAMEDVVPVSGDSQGSVEAIPPAQANDLYAALYDWIDPDDTVFTSIAGTLGAEATQYFGVEPDRAPPNRELQRLSEVRLVNGVAESNIAWKDWRERFSIYEAKQGEGNLYPGLLNVNGATHEQIVRFLEARQLDQAQTNSLTGTLRETQSALNEYAANAEAIAVELAPDPALAGVAAQKLAVSDIRAALDRVGVPRNAYKQVFSVSDDYFRVRIVILVGETNAELEAVVYTKRDKLRRANEAQVLEYRLR